MSTTPTYAPHLDGLRGSKTGTLKTGTSKDFSNAEQVFTIVCPSPTGRNRHERRAALVKARKGWPIA